MDSFEFGETRIVGADKISGVMSGLRGPSGISLKRTGNLFGDKGGWITSGEEGWMRLMV